jgi:hypothetical protein
MSFLTDIRYRGVPSDDIQKRYNLALFGVFEEIENSFIESLLNRLILYVFRFDDFFRNDISKLIFQYSNDNIVPSIL